MIYNQLSKNQDLKREEATMTAKNLNALGVVKGLHNVTIA